MKITDRLQFIDDLITKNVPHPVRAEIRNQLFLVLQEVEAQLVELASGPERVKKIAELEAAIAKLKNPPTQPQVRFENLGGTLNNPI